MRLVFIHGWAFDARFWDALASELTDIPQTRIDQGFFGTPTQPVLENTDILVGHSLGFVHGLTIFSGWAGWIALNSFPRFVAMPDKPGCVDAAALESTHTSLLRDPAKCLQRFHAKLGSAAPHGTPDPQRLLQGLNALRDEDVTITSSPLGGRTGGESMRRRQDNAEPHRKTLHAALPLPLPPPQGEGNPIYVKNSRLVLASRDDFLVPAATSEALAHTAHANIAWSDDGGHLLPLIRPAWCAEKIRAHVKSPSRLREGLGVG